MLANLSWATASWENRSRSRGWPSSRRTASGSNSSFHASLSPACLDIIHTAFEHPEAILNPVDREPRAAMFLLQYFASTSNDQGLQERISGEAESLRAVAARSAARAASQAN